MKPGGPERISYPVPFSDTRREVHIPKASRGKSNLNINQTCLQDVSRQCVSKNFYSLCLVFCVVLCGSLFAFYPLWCQSLFFSIVVPVFVFYLLWCQSLCFSQPFFELRILIAPFFCLQVGNFHFLLYISYKAFQNIILTSIYVYV